MTAAQPVAPSSPFPPLTPAAWRVLAIVALLFLGAVAFRLNGSSTAYWSAAFIKDIHLMDVPNGLLLSTPKNFRADEWDVWTPAMLNQTRHDFPISNPTLGPDNTPLLMGIPARHYTMAFRPGLWGFFAMPFDYGFSWYWCAKVFGLFAGVFALGWMLTGGRLVPALFGAMAVQFSPFLQWWFSTPAMLPEMLMYWSLGLVGALALFAPGTGWRRRVLAMGATAYCAAGFGLTCYPAFQIPLVHVGVCILAGYLWQHRLGSWRGAAWLAGALALAGIALVPWVLDCLPALRIEAATVYPGQRHVYGGDTLLLQYFSGLLDLAMTEGHAHKSLNNVCEASNFFPLWLLPFGLGVFSFLTSQRGARAEWLRARGLKVALAFYLAAVTLYMFVALPPWLAQAFLLDRSYGRRSLLGLGVAGTLLLALCLEEPAPAGRSRRRAVFALLGWALLVAGILVAAQRDDPAFLTVASGAALFAVAVVLGAAYLAGPRWLLPAAWAAVFVSQTALINPVCDGLPSLLESPMMQKLGAIVHADPDAEWAMYNGVVSSELFKAVGARIINGVRIIPDPELIHKLDPAGAYPDIFNRYSHLCFGSAAYDQGIVVAMRSLVYVQVSLHPRRLREIFPDLRYLASPRAMPEAEEAGFRLVWRYDPDHLWLYAIVPAPEAAATPIETSVQ